MTLLIIILASILSAYLIDSLPIWKNTRKLAELQKKSFSVISDKTLQDDQKQKMLLNYSRKIFSGTILLFLLFILALIPFALVTAFAGISHISPAFNEMLFSFKGICISFTAFLVYYLVKLVYARYRLQ